MKKLTALLLAVLVGLFMIAGTAQAKDKPTTGTWTGTLIDKHCGAKTADAASHDKECAMKCAKNGKDLGMIVDGKWYAFDKKGEKLAWNILKSAKADKNIQVNVDGKLRGNKITVTKMTEKV